MFKVAVEKLGKKSPGYTGLELLSLEPENERSIILFPTNGVGFGHFTRMLAIARGLRERDPELEIVFFTTMPTLHILTEKGFPAYHLTGRKHFDGMEPSTWNGMCEEMMRTVFRIHRPQAFIFDGAFPYRGMLNAINSRPDMLKIWMRRGMNKSSAKNIPVDSVRHFDLMLSPGDSFQTNDGDDVVKSIVTGPITLIDEDELLDSTVLRSRIGVPEDCILAYVQLGAGRINDINSEIGITLDEILSYDSAYVVIGESMIGERIRFQGDRVRILRDFPNAIFFNSFDFAVIAGGYNSFHEVLRYGTPSICYPNLNTGKDDQLGRSREAEKAGAMIVVKNRTRKTIKESINRIMDPAYREEMRRNASAIQSEDGTAQAAGVIIEEMERFQSSSK